MNLLLAVIINDDEALGRETMASLFLVKTHLREERNCPCLGQSLSLIYSIIQTNPFYLLIRATALVALVLTTEASDKTTKLKIIIIKPFLYY